ncbi:MAG TPA: CAP domain-containing protein [Nannocystaceae bacterium]|nr:CAP domain-containing protein [Nannocystaceae bacterium]
MPRSSIARRISLRLVTVGMLALTGACLAEPLADDEDDGGDDGPTSDGDDVPSSAYCDPVADWDPGWAMLEVQVLEIVNQRRAEGANCHTAGMFGPTTPLTMNPMLRCSARKHSADMAARNFFDHDNPDGEDPFARMEAAGYSFQAAGENIAGGYPDAAGTMMQWMESDGHCSNIMNPGFTEIGVGYSSGGQYGTLWTQNFGTPL